MSTTHSVRGSASSAVTGLFGTITAATSTLTLNLDSLAQLSRAGNTKARYYAADVEANCASLSKLNRAATKHRNAKALTDLKADIAKSLEDEAYAALYAESLAELSGE